jgi:predicted amidophosphoribosyltransferase
MIFVEHCESCGAQGHVLCTECTGKLSNQDVPHPVVIDGVSIEAAFEYAGVVKALVLRLKRHRSIELADLLARLTMARLDLEGWEGVVTWAPTTSRHLRVRGHDQAHMLATSIGRRLGERPRRLLRRVGATSQTGASRSLRLQGPTFVARPMIMNPRCSARPILIVDDVVTTGATLRGAFQSLSVVHAADVRCVAIAATPGRMGAR